MGSCWGDLASVCIKNRVSGLCRKESPSCSPMAVSVIRLQSTSTEVCGNRLCISD
jgi:hypothetical protein